VDKDDQYLLAHADDKIRQCGSRGAAEHTAFLDARQQTLLRDYLRGRGFTNFLLDGGYDDAERRVCVFLPEAHEFDADGDSPLCFIRLTKPANAGQLTHRDYLGALMGLGLKRETVGDILVREGGADLAALREVADFLLAELDKAGRATLKAARISRAELAVPEANITAKRDTVASLRLDNILASAFSMSRASAAGQIAAKNVFVNGVQAIKPDQKMLEGDKLVIRGKGKAVLREVSGRSRKDRIFVEIDKYN